MAIALVQSAIPSPGTSGTASAVFNVATTAGNTIVLDAAVCQTNSGEVTFTTPTNFTKILEQNVTTDPDNGPRIARFIRHNAPSTTTVDIAASAIQDTVLHAYEYSGLNQSSTIDQSSSSAGYASSGLDSGLTGTTTQGNELLLAMVAHRNTYDSALQTNFGDAEDPNNWTLQDSTESEDPTLQNRIYVTSHNRLVSSTVAEKITCDITGSGLARHWTAMVTTHEADTTTSLLSYTIEDIAQIDDTPGFQSGKLSYDVNDAALLYDDHKYVLEETDPAQQPQPEPEPPWSPPTESELVLALQYGHKVASKAEVRSFSGEIIDTLTITNGNITVDASNLVRRTCVVRATVDSVPSSDTHPLHPLANNDLWLYRGIYWRGQPYYIPQGVFRIFKTTASDSGEDVSVEIQGADYAKIVQRARMLTPYQVMPGTPYEDAIKNFINDGVPGLTYNIPATGFVTPKLILGASGDQAGGDRMKFAAEMAASIGYELYFDVQPKTVTMRPIANPSTGLSRWTFAEGEVSTLLYLSRELDIEETYNHVIASGENTSISQPARAEAYDDNPNSRTYIGDYYGTDQWVPGAFGDVPFFLRSQYITTEAQAQAAADAKLQTLLGATEQVQLTSIVVPFLEPNQVIGILASRVDVDSRYVIDKLNIPLTYEQSMNITARERRI